MRWRTLGHPQSSPARRFEGRAESRAKEHPDKTPIPQRSSPLPPRKTAADLVDAAPVQTHRAPSHQNCFSLAVFVPDTRGLVNTDFVRILGRDQ
jgi:hypothetical protein